MILRDSPYVKSGRQELEPAFSWFWATRLKPCPEKKPFMKSFVKAALVRR